VIAPIKGHGIPVSCDVTPRRQQTKMADSDSSSGEESSSQASTCSSSSVLDLEGEIKPYMFEPRYKSDEIPSSISNDEEMPLIEEELSDRLHNSDWYVS